MHKVPFLSLAAVALVAAGVAHATPEALPASAKVTCVANADGTGTLTVTGVSVKRVELYTHAPVSKKDVLSAAATYVVPAMTTFNFVWKNAGGEDRYVLVGGDNPADVANVFVGSNSKSGLFNGVMAVPEAKDGGIGHDGASLGCSHMLRAARK